MKRKFLMLLSVLMAGLLLFTGCAGKKEEPAAKKDTVQEAVPVTLCEVAHSCFYAPMYVAIEKGYFAEEGIDLTLNNGAGADNVMNAMIAGDADIGFMGSEASIYVYTQGKTDYAVNFAQLTQRAGNFLVAREADDDFTWADLKDKVVLGGRAGGMPEMVFEYILKQNGIDPAEVKIDQSVSFGNTAAAFLGSDEYEYTVEFEPFATSLESQQAGHIVASLGVDSGYVPYTAFCARKSLIEEKPELIQAFTDALQKGMDYVQQHSPEEIAEVIKPQFAETDMEALTTIIRRYYEQDTWKEDLIFTEDAFDLLTDILKDAGELKADVPYDALVDTTFAEKAAR